MIIEVMLVGLSYIGTSNTIFPGKLSYNYRPKFVATPIECPVQSKTEDAPGFWVMKALGENYFKLASFARLKKGWNGYEGEAIPIEVITKVTKLLLDLSFQPNIFPTGRGSIQVEHYRNEEIFVELEVFEDNISVYYESVRGTIEDDSISEKNACKLLEEVHGEK